MSSRKSLGFGCVSLTQHFSVKDALYVLSTAFNEGIVHYDTAPLYGKGYSEKILGKFIKNKRDKITIATKCGLGSFEQLSLPTGLALPLNYIKNKIRKKSNDNQTTHPLPLAFRSIGADTIRASLQTSLGRLQTGHIDYYLLHEAMPGFLTEEALRFLLDQKQKGVIGELGVAASFVNLQRVSINDLVDFSVLQYENGILYNSDDLLDKFPGKKHFYHSSLKSIQVFKSTVSTSEIAGILLSKEHVSNPSGKILFSTTKAGRLKKNITSFDKFSNLSLSELNNIINGLHRS